MSSKPSDVQSVVKTGPDVAHDGDVISFDIAVSNLDSAPITLNNPVDSIRGTSHTCDSLTFTSGDGNGNGKLDPTETWHYTCTYTVAHGDEDSTHHVINDVTVSGKTDNGDSVPPGSPDGCLPPFTMEISAGGFAFRSITNMSLPGTPFHAPPS